MGQTEVKNLWDSIKKNVEVVMDEKNSKMIQSFIGDSKDNMIGELELYSLYLNKSSNQEYALLYADYYESKINQVEFDDAVLKDAIKLKNFIEENKSELRIKYFFIMPYFNYRDRKTGSILNKPVLTNEI